MLQTDGGGVIDYSKSLLVSLKQENNKITNCKVQTFYVSLLSGWILSQLFPFRVCKCASFKA